MSKPVKDMIIRDLAARYANQNNAVWVEMTGVDGLTSNEFRRALRARQMRLEMVRTALFRRACQTGPMSRLASQVSGPVALITGGESAVDTAKLLVEWTAKLQPKLRIRGALLDGEYLDERQAANLSSMPCRADLQRRIVSLVLSPGGNVVAAVLGPGGAIAGLLHALIDKLEKGEEIKRSA